jgi:hypothetical protein
MLLANRFESTTSEVSEYTNGGVAMIAWLLKNLVQEVPEQLSVCEFDCPNNECTISDWVGCELRQQALLQENSIPLQQIPMVPRESAVFSPSSLLKIVPG